MVSDALRVLEGGGEHDLVSPGVASTMEDMGGDEFQAVKMRREWAEAAWDKHRDSFTAANRLEAWDRLEEKHQTSKAKGMRVPYDFSLTMLSGGMGEGKTLVAGLMAAPYYEQGMEVFSSASFLFGHRIDPVQIYTFAEAIPDNSFLFIDEAHILADAMAESSTRNRTLANCVSLLRKKGIRLVIASVHEHRVAWSLKGEADVIIYPYRYTPNVVRPAFPPWCYVLSFAIGPKPFSGSRLGDRYDIPRRGGKTRKVMRPPFHPKALFEMGKLIDTWDKPDILAGINTTADMIRGVGSDAADLAEAVADDQLYVQFMTALASAIDDENYVEDIGREVLEHGKGSVSWQRLHFAATRHGWQGQDKLTRRILQARFDLTTTYRVRRSALREAFAFEG